MCRVHVLKRRLDGYVTQIKLCYTYNIILLSYLKFYLGKVHVRCKKHLLKLHWLLFNTYYRSAPVTIVNSYIQRRVNFILFKKHCIVYGTHFKLVTILYWINQWFQKILIKLFIISIIRNLENSDIQLGFLVLYWFEAIPSLQIWLEICDCL